MPFVYLTPFSAVELGPSTGVRLHIELLRHRQSAGRGLTETEREIRDAAEAAWISGGELTYYEILGGRDAIHDKAP